METWIDNGAQLAWMIDPFAATVTIYRPGREPAELQRPETVNGEGPIEGFVLRTEKLWA